MALAKYKTGAEIYAEGESLPVLERGADVYAVNGEVKYKYRWQA